MATISLAWSDMALIWIVIYVSLEQFSHVKRRFLERMSLVVMSDDVMCAQ